MAKLRIVLADDHAVVRAGLEMLINAQADMEVVGQASDGQEAAWLAQDRQPDVVVMDVSMPALGGIEATAKIKQDSPRVCVLVLTRHDNQGYLRRLLQAGATGYIVKKTAADELITAIRIVSAGGTYIDPRLAGDLVERLVGRSAATEIDRTRGQLTDREEEVLRCIAWGQSNKEIAAQFGISVKTVEYHKASAGGKLHLTTRTDILRYALAQGWMDEDKGPE